ncbi:hypothetical protein ABZ656_51580 [Streptomyces sp. NPDC007095]
MDDELITERHSVAFPQVFGYVRHVAGGLAAWPATRRSSTASASTAVDTS